MALREYIGDGIRIDGRMIPYRIVTACDYLEIIGMTEEEIEDFAEKKYETYKLINQIIAIKQSCFLLRHTNYSCGSLSDHLIDLRDRLIVELKDKYNFDFDNDLMESDEYCGEIKNER